MTYSHLSKKSTNKKVVGKTRDGYKLQSVTTTGRQSCPDGCEHKDKTCYADEGFLPMHWNLVSSGKRGEDFESFLKKIEAIPEGNPWRHNQGGDLLGYDHDPANSIDSEALAKLARANTGKRGFTYTHKEVEPSKYVDTPTAKANLEAITKANLNGFTVNLSANGISQADRYYKTGNPVAVTVPEDTPEKTTTPEGVKVVVCPVQTEKAKNCAECLLCQRGKRKVIVAFRVHSASKAKFKAIA
jgi:hypothetical protein